MELNISNISFNVIIGGFWEVGWSDTEVGEMTNDNSARQLG